MTGNEPTQPLSSARSIFTTHVRTNNNHFNTTRRVPVEREIINVYDVFE